MVDSMNLIWLWLILTIQVPSILTNEHIWNKQNSVVGRSGKMPKLIACLSQLSLHTMWQSWSRMEYPVGPPLQQDSPQQLRILSCRNESSFSDQCCPCWSRWIRHGHAALVLAFFLICHFLPLDSII